LWILALFESSFLIYGVGMSKIVRFVKERVPFILVILLIYFRSSRYFEYFKLM